MKTRLSLRAIEYFQNYPSSNLKDSILYSLLNFGKCVRSNLYYYLCQDLKIAFDLDLALAIEMIHAYSLIHDDLPAMDNANYRRGKITNHRQFDEATAILAGDALLTHSFDLVILSKASNKITLIQDIVQHIGINGILGGQDLDIQIQNPSIEQKQKIDRLKTTKLFILTAKLTQHPIINNSLFIEAIELLGEIFQNQDDYLDLFANAQELGKDTMQDQNKQFTQEHYLEIFNTLQNKWDKFNCILSQLKLLQTQKYLKTLINRSK